MCRLSIYSMRIHTLIFNTEEAGPPHRVFVLDFRGGHTHQTGVNEGGARDAHNKPRNVQPRVKRKGTYRGGR